MDVLRRIKIELDTTQPKRALEELEREERQVGQQAGRAADALEGLEQAGREVAGSARAAGVAIGAESKALGHEAAAAKASESAQRTANAQRDALGRFVKASSAALHEGARAAQGEASATRAAGAAAGTAGQAHRKLADDARAAGRAHGEAARQAHEFGSSLLSVRSAIAGLGIGLLVREVTEAALAIDRIERSLAAAAGSSAGGAREFAFVRSEAQRLGLDLEAAATQFSQMAAAARGTVLEGQGARTVFTAVSEAMTVLGRSSADTGGAINALQQIISKGKVSAEELRQQLGERLPGAVQIMARSMGVSTRELDKLLEQGKVGLEVLVPFAEELRRTFGSQLETAITGRQADINRLKTALFDLRAAGGEGFFEGFASGLTDLQGAVTSQELRQAAAELGQNLGTALRLAADGAVALARSIDTVTAAVAGLVAARSVVAIGAFAQSLMAARAAADLTKVSVLGMNAALLASPWGAAAAAIGLATGGFLLLKGGVDGAREAHHEYNRLLADSRELSKQTAAATNADAEALFRRAVALRLNIQAQLEKRKAELDSLSRVNPFGAREGFSGEEAEALRGNRVSRVQGELDELNAALVRNREDTIKLRVQFNQLAKGPVVPPAATAETDKLSKAQQRLENQIAKTVEQAEREARQLRELGSLAAGDEAGRRRLSAAHQVENALRTSGIKLSEQEIKTLIEGGRVASESANRLRDATKAKLESAEASDKAKRAYESEQAAQRDLSKLLAEVATAQQKAAEASRPKATAEQAAAREAANGVIAAQLQLIANGIPLWSRLAVEHQLAAVALAHYNSVAAKTNPPSLKEGFDKLGIQDPSSPDFSAAPDYNPFTGATRASEEAAREASDAWQREFTETWSSVADIGIRAFETWASGGEVTARDVAQDFLSIWTQAFREWLQQWLANLAKAQAAQQAANLGNVSVGSSGGGAGQTAGAAAGAGSGWGAAAAAFWPAAVVAAVYLIADHFIEKKKSKRYGNSTEIGVEGGRFTGISLSENGNEINRSVMQFIRDFQSLTGGIVTEMDRLGIRIRADGESIKVTIGDMFVGTFDDMGQALAYGIQAALKSANIEGIGPEIRQLIERNQFATLEEFQGAVGTVQGVLDFGLSDFEREARAWSVNMDALIRQFQEWGLTTGAVADMATRNAQNWRDRITGVQRSEEELRELERQAYNRWAAMERARALAEIRRLQEDAARAGGPRFGPPGGGPNGPASGGTAGSGGRTFEAVQFGIRELGQSLEAFGVQAANTGVQLSVATAAATGGSDALAAAIKAWEEYIASLADIDIAEIQPTRNRGNGSGRNRQQELRDFREGLQEIRERNWTEPARAMAQMNREIARLNEEGRKAGATAAELASAEAALREERGRAMKEQIRPWTTGFGRTDFSTRLEEERRRVQELRDISRADRLRNGGPTNWQLNQADANINRGFGAELDSAIGGFRGLGETAADVARQANDLRQNVAALGGDATETARRLAEIGLGEAFKLQQGQLGVLDRLFGYLRGSEAHAGQLAEHERARLALEFQMIEAQLRLWNIWNETTRKLLDDARTAANNALTPPAGSNRGGQNRFEAAAQAQEEANRKFQEAVNRFNEGTKRLIEFQQSLRLDDSLTFLNPREQVEEARRQLDAIVAQARAGDLQAREDVEGAASAFLREFGETYGRGAAFAQESQGIDQLLTELIAATRFRLDNVTFNQFQPPAGVPFQPPPSAFVTPPPAPTAASGSVDNDALRRIELNTRGAGGEIALFRLSSAQSAARFEQRLLTMDENLAEIRAALRLTLARIA